MENSGNALWNKGPGRRRWGVFALVLAVLVAGGAIWASTQFETSTVSAGTSPSSTSSAAATEVNPETGKPSDSPSAAAPSTSAPAAPPAEPAVPGPAPAASGPQPAQPGDPAPVDRSNKSDEELATIEQPVAPPVPLMATKVVRTGVSATISEMEAVEGEARGIGEVAGPALRFKVTVINDSAAEISLDTAVITVSYGGDNSPASGLSGPNTEPFPATVAAGTSASGIFVFSVPKEARSAVKIYLNLDAGTPIAAFEGQAPA